MNIIQAIRDPDLFGPFLGKLRTWSGWLTALRTIYGLPVRGIGPRKLITECMGRNPSKLPPSGFDTTLLLTGRRSGKSRIAAVIGAYEAVLAGHESKLSKGERGVVPIISPTKHQSRVVRDYIKGIFEAPLLKRQIVKDDREGFELRNGTRIVTLAGDWRTVRNFTCLCVVLDEAAFLGYGEDSKVRSDTELVRAIQPSLATVQGKLIAISSPYATKGWCYQQFKRHHGKNTSKTLVWNCSSRTMNATLPQRIVDEAMEEDRASALAEYFGQFRDDICSFLPRDMIERLVVPGRKELLPDGGRRYSAFCDISGGRVDDAAIAIAHRVNRVVVVDFIKAWKPPFSPDAIVGDMVAELARFGIDRIVGDNYSAGFIKNSFERRGIRYAISTDNPWHLGPKSKTPKPKSVLYLELLPRLCSGLIELPDNEQLVSQLAGLERRTRSGGRDTIDHGPNGHDDVANVVAGVAVAATQRSGMVGAWSAASSTTETVEQGTTWLDRQNQKLEDDCSEMLAEQHLARQPDQGHPVGTHDPSHIANS